MKSLFILFIALATTFAHAGHFDYRPERPGRPGRPERPIRPEPPRRHERVVMQSLGSVRTNKLISETHSFHVSRHIDRVFRVELVGLKGTADIQSVQVHYEDGLVEELHELRGSLHEGRAYATQIYGRYVREIRVTATSGLIGSRGEIQVNIGVLQY